MPSFYEFFAGGGMARLGLGNDWKCEFANDISPMKANSYCKNFEGAASVITCCDINELKSESLPGNVDMVWGSFPCQDLSLAGSGRGLSGDRSGLIWRLLDQTTGLKKLGRSPKILVLENVTGLLNAKRGNDFYAILSRLRAEGFLFGIVMMDAIHFLPQSRPRLFLVAVDTSQVAVNPAFINGRFKPDYPWTSSRLDKLWLDSPWDLRDSWVWWNLPHPPKRRSSLMDVLDTSVITWDKPDYTNRLLSLMAPLHLEKVRKASKVGSEVVGTLYRRTRTIEGEKAQRVEVRFDGVSGCLRTPSGGSSRQRLLFVHGSSIRSRLLTTREAARLMGIPEHYRLPESYNDGYQIAGDGVAVPVVRWLSQHLLLPLVTADHRGLEGQTELMYA